MEGNAVTIKEQLFCQVTLLGYCVDRMLKKQRSGKTARIKDRHPSDRLHPVRNKERTVPVRDQTRVSSQFKTRRPNLQPMATTHKRRSVRYATRAWVPAPDQPPHPQQQPNKKPRTVPKVPSRHQNAHEYVVQAPATVQNPHKSVKRSRKTHPTRVTPARGR